MAEINEKEIKRRFEAISSFKTRPEVVARDLERVRQMLTKQANEQETRPQNIWRIIMRSRISKLAAAAVIIAVFMGIYLLGIESTGKAFAAAIDSVKQAQTFSCREIFEATREDGQKFVLEQEWMFKEPDLERHVYLSGVDDRFIGQVTITDYRKRQQLELNPVDKTATLYDKSSDYVVDADTGKLELSQLDISLRDRLLHMRIGAVEDLGSTELYGQLVRMLQSRQNGKITTVWINPQSGLPVQIEIKWANQHRTPVLYTSIKIDEELDDDLFSLEPPDGYHLRRFTKDWPVNKKKMSEKIMHLLLKCAMFAGQHDGQYPKELVDLEEVGVTNEILEVILAAPDLTDGPAVIQYIQPRLGTEWSTEVVIYEVYDKWPNHGIVVGFADGHCELIAEQQLFEELLE